MASLLASLFSFSNTNGSVDRSHSPAPQLSSQSKAKQRRGSASVTPPPPKESKKKLERRTMPARLRQVSSLLAGSSLQEQLLDTQQKLVENDALIPNNTKLIITSDPDLLKQALPRQHNSQTDALSIFADPKVAKACRETVLIETPKFKLRDDTEVLGKTRNSRNEEDTSDQAYELRFKKPENLEKKQRKMELERLVRDRQKHKERIEQLKTADPRLLMPILTARDQHQRAAASSNKADGDHDAQHASSETGVSSPRGVEAAFGLGKHHMSLDAVNTLARLEELRKELLDEAYEILARYDLLVPGTSERKRKVTEGEDSDSDASVAMRTPRRTNGSDSLATSPSTPDSERRSPMRIRLKRSSLGSGNGHADPTEQTSPRRRSIVNLRLSRSSGSLRSAATPKPVDGKKDVLAEHVHARTSGGRFASKAALKGGKPKASSTTIASPTPASRHSTRTTRNLSASTSSSTLSEASIPRREVKDHTHEYFPRPPQPRYRSVSPEFPTLLATGSAKTGASLAEIHASERKPKRVKVILKRPGQETPPPVTFGSALTQEQAAAIFQAALAETANGKSSDVLMTPKPPSAPATPPLRRGSQRVRSVSAFGEKVPALITTRSAFDDTIEPLLFEKRSWMWAVAARGYPVRDPRAREEWKTSRVGRRLGQDEDVSMQDEQEDATWPEESKWATIRLDHVVEKKELQDPESSRSVTPIVL